VIDGSWRTPLDVLEGRAKDQPDRSIVRFEDGHLTYADIERGSTEMAAGFESLGLAKGDTVATMLDNGPDAVLVWFGLAKAGIVEVPINGALSGELLIEQIGGADCRAVVVSDDYLEQVREVAPVLSGLRHIITTGSRQDEELSLSGIRHRDVERTSLVIAPTQTAVVLFTSGTTGPSKGVELQHSANYRLAEAVVLHAGMGSDDVLFTAFPLFHIAARFVSVVAAMLADAEVVVHRHFSASGFWDICRAEGITAIHYLGSVPMMLHKQPAKHDDVDNPVRIAYGAGLPAGIWEEFQRRFGLQAFELYGSTEQGVTAMMSSRHRVRGSCGPAVSWVDLEIHDERDTPVPAGVAGEIVVRPREPGIFFGGYRGMPEATLASWRNLWFHTGDIGYLDRDGSLFFMGRLKDAIRYRGENISAWEVERVLMAHQAVAEAAAVGVASDLGEEDLLVVIVPESEEPTPEEIIAHCEALLPAHAVPRYIKLVAALPKTPSDRVEKFRLRADGVAAGTWDRLAG
jgi:crotonobetaine/carnitine-CoA ligase